MIYKYSKFVNENSLNNINLSGTKEINEKEFKYLLDKYCSNFNWNDLPIYRSNSGSSKYMYVDAFDAPKSYKHYNKKLRKSAHLHDNIYTLLINHLPSWKKFPKRQVICSTEKVMYYDKVYRVIPFNNSKWGIVPLDDIQGKILIPSDLRTLLEENFDNYDQWEMFYFKNVNNIFDYYSPKVETYNSLKNMFKNNNVDINDISKILRPESMKFVYKTYKQLMQYDFPYASSSFYGNRKASNELWTDSNVLLYEVPEVSEDEIEEFLGDEMGEGYSREDAIEFLRD